MKRHTQLFHFFAIQLVLFLLLTLSVPVSASEDYTGQGSVGSEWLCSIIDGVLTDSTPADEKQDFFTAVNRDFLAAQTIKPGMSEAGVTDDAAEIVSQKTLNLLADTSIESHEAHLAQTLYRLALDWDTRNADGVTPFLDEAQSILSISSMDDLNAFMLSDKSAFTTIPTMIYVENSLIHPGTYQAAIYSTPLFLKDSAEYQSLTETGRKLLENVRGSVLYTLSRLGINEQDAQQILEDCLAFEREVAADIYTSDTTYEDGFTARTLNEVTMEQIPALQGSFPLDQLLKARHLDSSAGLRLHDPAWLQKLGQIWDSAHLSQIRSYLLCHYANTILEFLDSAAYEQYVDLQNQYYGSTGSMPDEKYAMYMVSNTMPYVLDYAYIDQYGSLETRDKVRKLTDDFIQEYREMLLNETWLEEETRKNAVDKLDHMHKVICFSDSRIDYSTLDIRSKSDGGSLKEALQKISDFDNELNRKRLNTPLDPDLMPENTRSVNAYYDPSANAIVILMGMLEGACSPDQPYEAMLGSLGASVIGHELTHAFDSEGSQYDRDGNFSDWWNEADKAAFSMRTNRVAEYLNQIVPYPGAEKVSGQMNKIEMTADLGGMACALRIAGKKAGFDYDTFFRAFAHCWADKYAKDVVDLYIHTDEHPLQYLRTNITVQQSDEFMQTYHVTPGDGMYLAPEDRINVW
ncbi:MAG: M13 family metallopeptidase [Clostridia bacterium]|nr:M13 family metallopeptidase [Clostridia bacterium]